MLVRRDADGNFVDLRTGKQLSDVPSLKLVQQMKIPPGYRDVVINTSKCAKAYAWGFDKKGRKQILYNQWYIDKKQKDKYRRILKMEPLFHKIHADAKRIIAKPSAPWKARLIALAVLLIVECHFRIGSEKYLRENQSYGITTLEWSHLTFHPQHVDIEFVGKKGVMNKSKCTSLRVRNFLKELRTSMPKSHNVFSYLTDDHVHQLTAKDVNDFLKTYHPDITSKDLRTWQANLLYIKYSNQHGISKSSDIIKLVAHDLHNTPAVCARNYLHPKLLKKR